MAEKKGYNRRDFLKVLGASSGVAAAGCAADIPEKLVPYVVQPDEVVPGVATWYSSSCNECDAGCGILVRTREGRAVKVEGNPKHPVNRGGLCSVGQSSLQGLYDPDRVREPLKRQVNGSFRAISWKEAIDEVAKAVAASGKTSKETVLLTRPLSGSAVDLVKEFTSNVSGARHHTYDLLNTDALDAASEQVFGKGVRTHFDFSAANLIVSFGADFLETWSSPVSNTKGFASKRKPGADGSISEFVHVEPRLSLTAANADTWIRNRPESEIAILLALGKLIVTKGGAKAPTAGSRSALTRLSSVVSGVDAKTALKGTGVTLKQVEELAEKLTHTKQSLVLAGGVSVSGPQATNCAVLANLINASLNNVGSTLKLYRGAAKGESSFAQMKDLIGRLESENVGVLLLSDVNPAYTMPGASKFREALTKAGLVVSVSSQLDETSQLANIVLPLSSGLESWGDAEPLPGVYNLMQPALQPLYATQSFGDTLIGLAANEFLDKPIKGANSYLDYIKAKWKKRVGSAAFEQRWLRYVEQGGDWSKPEPALTNWSIAASAANLSESTFKESKGLTLIAYPTVKFLDGRTANRPWMQEVPDPMTTAVWGSWVEVHPKTAEAHGLQDGKVTQVLTEQGSLEVPVVVSKHIHEDVIAMPIGQGHTALGRYANGVGSNVLNVLSYDAERGADAFLVKGVQLRKSATREELVRTQGNDSQLDRGFLRTVSAATLAASASDHGHDAHAEDDHHGGHHDPHALGPREEPKQMYKQMEHVQYKWGMSIDLSSCTGCSACVTACYAENNVPVVGKEFCAQGREMSWIRVSRFVDGPEDSPVTGFFPTMCQHCGNAPCEPVCPVYATYHSDEGLNTMVYNRCVGTRYCGNNCSYKVRRFNWYNYEWPEPLNWQLNPDVTVRSLGVMEKCSFCIQRIREGENQAKDLGRPVQDGDIQPACASSCPADAISFGNLLDEESVVHKDEQSPRGYKVLDFELNTQPAVTYLAKVTHEEADAHKKDKDDHGGHH